MNEMRFSELNKTIRSSRIPQCSGTTVDFRETHWKFVTSYVEKIKGISELRENLIVFSVICFAIACKIAIHKVNVHKLAILIASLIYWNVNIPLSWFSYKLYFQYYNLCRCIIEKNRTFKNFASKSSFSHYIRDQYLTVEMH